MTAEDFEAWLSHMKISGREAARRLGMSKDTVASYRQNGAPRHVALACSALAQDLKPWDEYRKGPA